MYKAASNMPFDAEDGLSSLAWERCFIQVKALGIHKSCFCEVYKFKPLMNDLVRRTIMHGLHHLPVVHLLLSFCQECMKLVQFVKRVSVS